VSVPVLGTCCCSIVDLFSVCCMATLYNSFLITDLHCAVVTLVVPYCLLGVRLSDAAGVPAPEGVPCPHGGCP
jgi:hypothetical protein